MRILMLLSSILVLTACAEHKISVSNPPDTMYDYGIYREGDPLTLDELSEELTDADVVLLGEWHTHSGVHRFQTNLLQALDQRGFSVVLTMEQFSRDAQEALNAYLSDEIGEYALMRQGDAWSNYESDYRPIIEYAKVREIPVLGANAPGDIVRCINRQGLEYLDTLSRDKRKHVALEINTGESEYKKKFLSTMHHGTPEQAENLFAAQITRDETIAETIVRALEEHDGSKVILTAGKFHTEGGLGVGALIERRKPGTRVVVIDPVTDDINTSTDDYQLKVMPLPARFVKGEDPGLGFHFSQKSKRKVSCGAEGEEIKQSDSKT